MSTQEALTAELVKKPVKILLGGDKIRARSFALETFNPADIPENKKPKLIKPFNIYKDPKKALKGSDCVMTDKWVSMNDKVNKTKNPFLFNINQML